MVVGLVIADASPSVLLGTIEGSVGLGQEVAGCDGAPASGGGDSKAGGDAGIAGGMEFCGLLNGAADLLENRAGFCDGGVGKEYNELFTAEAADDVGFA